MSKHTLEALQRATQVGLPEAGLLEYWLLGQVFSIVLIILKPAGATHCWLMLLTRHFLMLHSFVLPTLEKYPCFVATCAGCCLPSSNSPWIEYWSPGNPTQSCKLVEQCVLPVHGHDFCCKICNAMSAYKTLPADGQAFSCAVVQIHDAEGP